MTTTDYDTQAQAFLDRFGLTFKAVLKGDRCPPWDKKICDHIHGDRYAVTIREQRPGRSRRVFRCDFWNSLNDSQEGKAPTAYGVLACLSSDAGTPDTFEDFCASYGYEEDSRSAYRIFVRADKQARRLRAFLTADEAEALAEVQ